MHLRFSQDIQALLERLHSQPITLRDILAETSERGFSLVIGLLVLPFLLPMPPGFTGILGSGCLLLSLQMAIGRRSPWLPRSVAQFQFPRGITSQVLQVLRRISRYIEHLVRPRWHHIANSPYAWQLNGLCISWLTILLMLPLPFTNPIPTIGILLFVVATLETDGLLMCLAYGMTGLITALFCGVLYLLWQSSSLILSIS